MEKISRPIVLVVGARPNFMKIAPLHSELKKLGKEMILVHTGQHYDQNMSKVFFDDLGLPEPNIFLGVGSGTHAKQTAKIMTEFECVCEEVCPSIVVVVGDVNSTLACTLVASKLKIPTAHIEAGLRSWDMKMPEEINRKVTDALANILFTPSKDGDENLIKEGRDEDEIFMVGNIMIDSLVYCLERASKSTIVQDVGVKNGEYGVLTLHRPSNVDELEIFSTIIEAIEQIGEEIVLVFPIHPRTKNRLEKFGLRKRIEAVPNIVITEPMGYLDFISLISTSRIVLTDSGGLQEETTFLKIPCLTLRDSTERPITVSLGTNKVVGNNKESIIEAFEESKLVDYSSMHPPPLWDGKTASRIAKILNEYLG